MGDTNMTSPSTANGIDPNNKPIRDLPLQKYLVEFEGQDDPDSPQNWPLRTR